MRNKMSHLKEADGISVHTYQGEIKPRPSQTHILIKKELIISFQLDRVEISGGLITKTERVSPACRHEPRASNSPSKANLHWL